MARGKRTVTSKRKAAAPSDLAWRCEGTLPPELEIRCPERAVTRKKIFDGSEHDVCKVHADAIDLMETRRRLAAERTKL